MATVHTVIYYLEEDLCSSRSSFAKEWTITFLNTRLQCDFESPKPCAWTFDPPSDAGGFRIISGMQNNKNESVCVPGHYAYFGTNKNEEVTVKIVSPYYQYTSPTCKLKFKYNLHGLPSKTEIFVVLDYLADQSTKHKLTDTEIKTFKMISGLTTTWQSASVNVGQIPRTTRIRLEAWLSNAKDNSLHVVPYTADAMIDDIALIDCEEELYHPDPCQSNRTKKYRCALSKVCIEWDQVCDMKVDCYGGDDEDANLHNCTQVPQGARCDFEKNMCGWVNITDIHGFRWLRVNESHKHIVQADHTNAEFSTDHTYKNASVRNKTREKYNVGLLFTHGYLLHSKAHLKMNRLQG
uniref:MAM domain-containing protein n=1 Tax=Romanomermis culicivorax TaxID=13658 RepID=A0A915JMK0_ROMCU